MIPTPFSLMVWLGVFVAALSGAFGFGYHTSTVHAASVALKLANANAAAYHETLTKLEVVSADLENARAANSVVTRTIVRKVDKLVDRPIYRNVCLDSDGLHAANEALRNDTSDPGEPPARLPPALTP